MAKFLWKMVNLQLGELMEVHFCQKSRISSLCMKKIGSHWWRFLLSCDPILHTYKRKRGSQIPKPAAGITSNLFPVCARGKVRSQGLGWSRNGKASCWETLPKCKGWDCPGHPWHCGVRAAWWACLQVYTACVEVGEQTRASLLAPFLWFPTPSKLSVGQLGPSWGRKVQGSLAPSTGLVLEFHCFLESFIMIWLFIGWVWLWMLP